jgi:hypothetical protein
MKRLVPIIRDDIYGMFDRDITGRIVLVTMDATQVSRMLVEILGSMLNVKGRKGVVLSYDRPARNIHRILKRFWIPTRDLVYVDGFSRQAGEANRPIGVGLTNPAFLDVLRPFSVGSVLERLRAAFLLHGSRRRPVDRGRRTDSRGQVDLGSAEEIALAELGLFGAEGLDWSMLRHRTMERARALARERGLVVGRDRTKAALDRRLDDAEDDGWEGAYAADFLVIENLAGLAYSLGNERLDDLLNGLRSLIAEGMCRCVIILLDRFQYPWMTEGLREMPDLRFDLETSGYLGIIGYRLVHGDNGA